MKLLYFCPPGNGATLQQESHSWQHQQPALNETTKAFWQLLLLQSKSKYICFGDNKKLNVQPLHPSHTEITITKMFLQKRKPSFFNQKSTYGKSITREENTGNSFSCSIWKVRLLPIRKSVGQKYELKASISSLTFFIVRRLCSLLSSPKITTK